jgi:hypothetical protein
MSSSFVGFERQQLVRCRILAELFRRRLPGAGGWSHCGAQCGTEPTSLALLALYSYPSRPTTTREELAIVRVPATEWALAGRCRKGGGREYLGERFGGQHADGSGGGPKGSRCFA